MKLPVETLSSLKSDAGAKCKYISTSTSPCHLDEIMSYHTFNTEVTPHPLKKMLVSPKNSYGRLALRVNVFLLPGIETRFFGRPVHILLQLLGLKNFQLFQQSLLYRPDLGPGHVGFVVKTVITRDVCL